MDILKIFNLLTLVMAIISSLKNGNYSAAAFASLGLLWATAYYQEQAITRKVISLMDEQLSSVQGLMEQAIKHSK